MPEPNSYTNIPFFLNIKMMFQLLKPPLKINISRHNPRLETNNLVQTKQSQLTRHTQKSCWEDENSTYLKCIDMVREMNQKICSEWFWPNIMSIEISLWKHFLQWWWPRNSWVEKCYWLWQYYGRVFTANNYPDLKWVKETIGDGVKIKFRIFVLWISDL